MVKTLALVAVCLASVAGNAMAQDAKTVIADARKALGDPKSITYSGSAKDVNFQQCGANAAQMICQVCTARTAVFPKRPWKAE